MTIYSDCSILFHSILTVLLIKTRSYNGIHDPTISMVATSTMIEGSLDVLSCATLMQLASIGLPASVNGAIVFFALLELVNACQSFALQVRMDGISGDRCKANMTNLHQIYVAVLTSS